MELLNIMKDSKLRDNNIADFFLKLSDNDKIVFQIVQNMNLNINKIFETIASTNNPFLSMKVLETEVLSIMESAENEPLLNLLSEHQKMHIEAMLYQYIAVTMTKTIFMRNQDINEQILLNNICSCNTLEN